MKQIIQYSNRVGINLLLIVVILVGGLTLSGTQTVLAAPSLNPATINYVYTASGWTVNHTNGCSDPSSYTYDVINVINTNTVSISTGDLVTVQFDFNPAIYIHSSSVTSLTVSIRLTDPNYNTFGGYPTIAPTMSFTGTNIQNATATFAGSDNYQGLPHIEYQIFGNPGVLIPDPSQDAMISSISVTFTAPGGGDSNPDFSNTTFIGRADISALGSCPDEGPVLASSSFLSCPVGQYNNGTSCVDADPGYFVPVAGSTSQTPCPVGTFQPLAGSSSCNPATPGYYVDTIGAVQQTLCPVGYTSEAGATECFRINTAPTANVGGPYLGAVNTDISFDGSASSDPEGDSLSYLWDFGDGSSIGSGVMPTHNYSEAGVYTVCLTVNDGALDSDPNCTMAVVYDPSAGFVTGGGWIDSSAGAYLADTSLAGKATFGFVSKYKKGATIPTGNTEFQFQTGAFNFHSDTYEWLVINQGGTNAQFKGSGMINGSPDSNGNAFKFMIWAGDSSPDTFQIKIWSEDSNGEHVIYDNGGQVIGGGNIVVHSN